MRKIDVLVYQTFVQSDAISDLGTESSYGLPVVHYNKFYRRVDRLTTRRYGR
jgi:hypothetical protein